MTSAWEQFEELAKIMKFFLEELKDKMESLVKRYLKENKKKRE